MLFFYVETHVEKKHPAKGKKIYKNKLHSFSLLYHRNDSFFFTSQPKKRKEKKIYKKED